MLKELVINVVGAKRKEADDADIRGSWSISISDMDGDVLWLLRASKTMSRTVHP
jgi:hypothetical protein